MLQNFSPLQKLRMDYKLKLPDIFKNIKALKLKSIRESSPKNKWIQNSFPFTYLKPELLSFDLSSEKQNFLPKKYGVVFSGGQAAGGHNVILGLLEVILLLNPKSSLIGFLDGPAGIIENKFIFITEDLIATYKNQGGFDLIGTGRTKIETTAQFEAVERTVRNHQLDGLVIIGGDDSNTNSAFLAEYFLKQGCEATVVGVPKTIDGDLKNQDIEISFGFDTATKTYSEIIGNLSKDAISAKKSYYFIKLMGRSASHITLECALSTRPNLVLIGEEIAEQKLTLAQVTKSITDLILERSFQNKEYGVILFAEGIIEFIPDIKKLIQELNTLLHKEISKNEIYNNLSDESKSCFDFLTLELQNQLFLERDPHGNIQVSKIETERLFIDLVARDLKKREEINKLKFLAQPYFCGYEGRCALPSNFDALYCYALGYTAGLLLENKATGYISCIKNLSKPVAEWIPCARHLLSMMVTEERNSLKKIVIKKALVDLKDKPYKTYKALSKEWRLSDEYLVPGPIQFYGPDILTDTIAITLHLEHLDER